MRLKALLSQVSQCGATSNATAQQAVSHVAPPSECDTRQAANDDGCQDLPLLAAVIEFQGLIDRLCRFRGHSEATRAELHALLNRKAPARILPELEEMRELVRRAEAGQYWPTLHTGEP